MQKKNQGANDDALADADEVTEDGGNKEPFHSTFNPTGPLTKCGLLLTID